MNKGLAVKNNDITNSGLKMSVTKIIHKMGVPAHIKGYNYIRAAIILSVEDKEMMCLVTKLLYPTIAKKYNTTSYCVERAIRHAIEIAWERGDKDALNLYFGYRIQNGQGKPSNSEFIAVISDELRLRLKNEEL